MQQKRLQDTQKLLTVLLLLSALIIYGYMVAQGNYFIYLDVGSDTMHSFYPIYRYAVACLREGTFSQWSFSIGTGGTTFNYTSVMMDPFAWPVIVAGAILGDQVIAGLLVVMQVVKILACGWVCLRFLRWHGITGLPAVAGAYAYGLNGFLMLWGQHYWLGTAAFWVIAFLALLEEALDRRRYSWKLSVVTALILLQSVYIGYMILVFAVVYGVLRIWYLHGRLTWREWWRVVCPHIASVLVGLLISMATFLPNAYLILRVSGRVDGGQGLLERVVECLTTPFSLSELKSILLRFVSNSAQATAADFQYPGYQVNTNYYEAVQLFFSVVFLVMVPVWLICRMREASPKHQKRSILVGVALTVLLIFHPFGSMVLNAFAYPFGRYTFLLMPLFAIVMAQGFRYVLQWKKPVALGLMALVCLNMTADGFVTTNVRGLASTDLVQPEKDRYVQDALEWIETQDDTFYRVEKTFYSVSEVMDSVAMQYAGISGYNSMIGSGLQEFYEKLWPEILVGDSAMRQYFTQDAAAWEQASFLGVKYLLAEPEDEVGELYVEIARQDNVVIYRNTLVESAGFITKTWITDAQLDEMEQEERVAALAQMLQDSAGQVTLYEEKDRIWGTVTAKTDGTLILAVPADYGWTVSVDGVQAEPQSAAYGYMAVAVEAGEHEIVMEFSMPGAGVGACLSLVGMIGLVAWLCTERRKQRTMNVGRKP